MTEPKKSGSQMTQEAMQQRAYQQHRERLANVKPSVDNKTPESAAYTRHVGRQKNNEKQFNQVEYENQVLVDRLVHIMSTKGGVDNSEPWRDKNKGVDSNRKRNNRQKEIDMENQRLLARLQNAKPTYSSQKMKSDRKKNETYASNISRYPYRPMDTAEPLEKEAYVPQASRKAERQQEQPHREEQHESESGSGEEYAQDDDDFESDEDTE
ncbi:KIAA1430 homologue, putative [Angomonas deanei]|uniref:KIAA1430 homologue, putative n=1 Tax=Angomonas deanei TaxID=59799 RepID=A0A7G2C3T5_9TRYP|nr:KIAA1430 homologue, putative [Angomonas deanei]